MINRAKVFWVAFAVAYVCLLVYGLTHERAGAFPTVWWFLGYLILVAAWAALAAVVALGAVLGFQHSKQIASHVADGIRSIGRWFKN